MKSRGAPPELRLFGHSQGYDLVERPLLRDDETMPLAANMNMAVHPGFFKPTNFAFICDNFLIKADGSVEHLHKSRAEDLGAVGRPHFCAGGGGRSDE